MKRTIFAGAALAAALVLQGCAGLSSGVQTAAMTSEKADDEALNLYIAISTGINDFEALPTTTASQKASAEKLRVQAWNDLTVANAAYHAGQVVSMAALLADQTAAAGVTGKAAAPAS